MPSGEQLVRAQQYAKPIILRMTRRDFDLTDDVLQTAVVKVLSANGHSSFKERSSFETWFTRIAMNECKMVFRAKREMISIDDADENGNPTFSLVSPSFLPSIEAKEDLRRLLTRVGIELGVKYELAFRLCYLEGMSYDEAAEECAVSTTALKGRVYRARRVLGVPHQQILFLHPRPRGRSAKKNGGG